MEPWDVVQPVLFALFLAAIGGILWRIRRSHQRRQQAMELRAPLLPKCADEQLREASGESQCVSSLN